MSYQEYKGRIKDKTKVIDRNGTKYKVIGDPYYSLKHNHFHIKVKRKDGITSGFDEHFIYDEKNVKIA
jgi:hypothetical protein